MKQSHKMTPVRTHVRFGIHTYCVSSVIIGCFRSILLLKFNLPSYNQYSTLPSLCTPARLCYQTHVRYNVARVCYMLRGRVCYRTHLRYNVARVCYTTVVADTLHGSVLHRVACYTIRSTDLCPFSQSLSRYTMLHGSVSHCVACYTIRSTE